VLDSERQHGIIVDLLLPLDFERRYDVYFTDKRIAIVCMGKADRADGGVSQQRSYLFGVAPEALVNAEDERKNRRLIEEEIGRLMLDEKLKLSKKSCFYTYKEIEEVKLVSGKKHKFIILSKEFVSKFAPNQEQFKQLSELLPTIEPLRSKLSIFGNLELNVVPEGKSAAALCCKICGYGNDFDAVFCQICGKQIQTENPDNPELPEFACGYCGAKNKVQALFCKKCGKPTGNT
jgi:hypothetical protein